MGVYPQDAQDWDAQMEVDVGDFILRLVDENPPPIGSRLAADFVDWGKRIERDGLRRRAIEPYELELDEMLRGHDAWSALADHERDRFVLEALGDQRMSTSDLAEAIKKTHDDYWVDGADMRYVLQRLVAAGEVARNKRYRYFRTPMSPELKALDDQFSTGEAAA